MWEIAFTVCSILIGAGCEVKSLTFADEGQGVMPYSCMVPAQRELAKWRDCNPNWSIQSWRCRTVRRQANV